MKKLTFSNADTREVFADKDYAEFSQLMFDTACGKQKEVSKEDANEKIREVMFEVLGVDQGCSRKELHKAIRRHKVDVFEVIEETVENLLNEKEIEWIVFCNTITPNGYNLSTGGDGHSKTVYQYDCETGEFLAEYPSLMTAA